MSETRSSVYSALKTIQLTKHIREYLKENDPEALEGVEFAISEIEQAQKLGPIAEIATALDEDFFDNGWLIDVANNYKIVGPEDKLEMRKTVVKWIHAPDIPTYWTHSLHMTVQEHDLVYREADGFGYGITPDEYDWSHVRDSSVDGFERMYAKLKELGKVE